VALPCILLSLSLGIVLALSAASVSPVWPNHGLNMSEAAALRDVAEVVRRLESGEDLVSERYVRAGVIGERPMMLTPMAAAVAGGDESMIRMLFRVGAVVDVDSWTALRCSTDRADVLAALDAHRPAGAVRECLRP
jgi:hypothetical protein